MKKLFFMLRLKVFKKTLLKIAVYNIHDSGLTEQLDTVKIWGCGKTLKECYEDAFLKFRDKHTLLFMAGDGLDWREIVW